MLSDSGERACIYAGAEKYACACKDIVPLKLILAIESLKASAMKLNAELTQDPNYTVLCAERLEQADGAICEEKCREPCQPVCGECNHSSTAIPCSPPSDEQTLPETLGAADPQIPAAPPPCDLRPQGLPLWHLLQSCD